ncbi:glycosyl hydrolase 115 family protein [Sphingomonas sp. DT-204]|uniref:glycosyl hydrolase 115 family protein n=1 Tax=Sphingomonas sp. DT-204 TaxID=3396166 RepID=UPI003F1DAB44
MNAIRRLLAGVLLLAAFAWAPARAAPLVRFDATGPGPVLADARGIAHVVTSPRDHEVVRIAAADLRRDLERVSGARGNNGAEIWLGTLGRYPAIDRLAKGGAIDVARLRGAWESFVIAVVERPAPGVPAALVIVGSDRRGTAYGAYELSRAIGVSPWHWWADVTPEHHPVIRAAPGASRFGPPSVKYRGIFLNDEDWGLEPWAARTFEPEHGTIGPKTYARLFELMLRLKANLLWPAMHKVTRPFNADPANARLADRYAIVMGSSHAEPMLRNNVGEWKGPAETYNYAANPEGVARYWRERVQANARYENVWTLGMRGIHDSGMMGPATDAERRRLLERIFADQRAMLRRHVDRDVARVPQVFTPYKEVLNLYRGGLAVPDDVTLMWPDDNFGYIRHFPDAAERRRSGGSGVYYHLSYLGAPLSYLWLSTTPPALIREELGRAFDLGARTMWVANVGDLKPAELATDYFLRLAWDVPGTRARPIDAEVAGWAGETIGRDVAAEIAGIMAEYHRLNFARRPEHLQWWLPGEVPRPSPLDPADADMRLTAFERLTERVRMLAARIVPDRRNAFFELVEYPVTASALANARVLEAEAHDRLRDTDPAEAGRRGAAARAADTALAELTRHYNEQVAGGKWRGIIAVEPADGQWRRFRITPPVLPAPAALPADVEPPHRLAPPSRLAIEADAAEGTPAGWRVVDGLGRDGAAVTAVRPTRLAYTVTLPPGRWRAVVEVLPTYPNGEKEPFGLALSVDAGQPVRLAAERRTGDAAWARAVLDNRIDLVLPEPLSGGDHRLSVALDGPGVILDRIRFDPVPAP